MNIDAGLCFYFCSEWHICCKWTVFHCNHWRLSHILPPQSFYFMVLQSAASDLEMSFLTLCFFIFSPFLSLVGLMISFLLCVSLWSPEGRYLLPIWWEQSLLHPVLNPITLRFVGMGGNYLIFMFGCWTFRLFWLNWTRLWIEAKIQ